MSEPLASAPPTPPLEGDGVSRLSERALQGLLRERGWRAATAALCTELTLALGCRRVALGWQVDGRVRVVGLSHGAQLAEHPVLGGVAEAMQEAMVQGLTLCVRRVADGAVRITLAQRALLKHEGVAGVLTVPLAQGGEVLGALLCERDEGRFTPVDIIAMEEVARMVAPLLRLLHEGELSWRQRWQRSWRAWMGAEDPRARRLRQLGLGTVLLCLVAVLAVPVPHHVQAAARVEGAEQRVLTAPIDGYLRQLQVRPGDFVKKGQLLAQLSDEDLRQQARSREAEIAQHDNAFVDAFTKGERSQAAQAQPRAEAQLSAVLDGIAQQSDEITSIGVRRRDGVLVAASADHERNWVPRPDQRSTLDAIVVPLQETGGLWGALELRYKADPLVTGWRGWIGGSMLALMISLGTAGLLVYYFYLRRMLQHLDPSQAIPERVRAAFDALAEGLLVLDQQQRIMLTNEAFSKLYPSEGPLLGKPVSELGWLTQALGPAAAKPPWLVAMQTREPVLGVQVRITSEGGENRQALMNCAAICDAKGAARGCVVTLDDVTELDRANSRLRATLGELERSHDRIQTQNVELEKLANHDPMTGCLNRRAFYARAEPLFARAREQGTPLACIMTDIDKFKNFNDTHGHAVGDQVIQQVAALLKSSLRAGDLLCRYGGEEFCIVLPNTALPEALRVAQRMRARMEAEAGPGVTSVAGLRITSSFGVCTLPESAAASLDKLIEQADAGLYAAKEAGRNRVRYAPGVQAEPDLAKSSTA